MKIYLDDIREAPEGWIRTRTVEATFELLKYNHVEALSLDNDLGSGYSEGYMVLDWLEYMVMENPKEISRIPKTIIPHTNNVVARQRMLQIINRLKGLKNAK